MQDDRIQQRLLSEMELDLTKAVAMAISMERAAKNVLDIQQNRLSKTSQSVHNDESEAVNRFQHAGQRKEASQGIMKTCFRCGELHNPEGC